MAVGAVDHVGVWFFMVIEIVEPIVRDGVPLSATETLKLQVPAGIVAVKATLQLTFVGAVLEPLTVTLKPQLVDPEQVIV